MLLSIPLLKTNVKQLKKNIITGTNLVIGFSLLLLLILGTLYDAYSKNIYQWIQRKMGWYDPISQDANDDTIELVIH
jgi:hypothetical protein